MFAKSWVAKQESALQYVKVCCHIKVLHPSGIILLLAERITTSGTVPRQASNFKAPTPEPRHTPGHTPSLSHRALGLLDTYKYKYMCIYIYILIYLFTSQLRTRQDVRPLGLPSRNKGGQTTASCSHQLRLQSGVDHAEPHNIRCPSVPKGALFDSATIYPWIFAVTQEFLEWSANLQSQSQSPPQIPSRAAKIAWRS